ncbi:MAG: endonuclease/exonuclease/phosphatase family protein [Phycisphaerales bacterium]|nr:endonuclease/exonuclease/phosphatase family protein [Phycisphaerales bacterium]
MIIKLTLSLLLTLSGCATTPIAPLTNCDPHLPPAQIILDGDLSDWYNQTGIRADSDEVFIAFDSFDESQAIQAADFTTRIRIDTDADVTTGKRQMYNAQEQDMMLSQGVDLTILVSPPSKEFGELKGGAQLKTHTTNSTTSISHSDAGFYFLPTHNAPRYEARIDRSLIPSLQHDGPISIVIEHLAIGGTILKTQSFTTTLPTYKPNPPINDAIASKPTNGLRIMATNVLFSSPLKNPEPFARVIDAINPDVILYQEWFKTTTKDVRGWFDENLDDNWTQSIIDPSGGVAIVTHLPIIEGGLKIISQPDARRTRSIAVAVLDAKKPGDTKPLPLIVVSLHLKCCGGAGSSEDLKRIAQAHKINTIIQELRKKYPNAGIVIGGDYNLVGSRKPLDIIADNLGIDHQDLTPVPTKVLGTQSMLTWTNAKSPYTPGRLDWILVDDHAWTPINSWSLDTARLSNQALKDAGLEREDSRATDHLPIVVDLIPAK